MDCWLTLLLGCSEKDDVAAAQIEKLIVGLQETDVNEFDPVQRIKEGFHYFKTHKFEYDTTIYAINLLPWDLASIFKVLFYILKPNFA